MRIKRQVVGRSGVNAPSAQTALPPINPPPGSTVNHFCVRRSELHAFVNGLIEDPSTRVQHFDAVLSAFKEATTLIILPPNIFKLLQVENKTTKKIEVMSKQELMAKLRSVANMAAVESSSTNEPEVQTARVSAFDAVCAALNLQHWPDEPAPTSVLPHQSIGDAAFAAGMLFIDSDLTQYTSSDVRGLALGALQVDIGRAARRVKEERKMKFASQKDKEEAEAFAQWWGDSTAQTVGERAREREDERLARMPREPGLAPTSSRLPAKMPKTTSSALLASETAPEEGRLRRKRHVTTMAEPSSGLPNMRATRGMKNTSDGTSPSRTQALRKPSPIDPTMLATAPVNVRSDESVVEEDAVEELDGDISKPPASASDPSTRKRKRKSRTSSGNTGSGPPKKKRKPYEPFFVGDDGRLQKKPNRAGRKDFWSAEEDIHLLSTWWNENCECEERKRVDHSQADRAAEHQAWISVQNKGWTHKRSWYAMEQRVKAIREANVTMPDLQRFAQEEFAGVADGDESEDANESEPTAEDEELTPADEDEQSAVIDGASELVGDIAGV